MLSGKHHFTDPQEMERQLKKEGVKIKNDTVVEFDKVFWDPVKELGFL
jgi:methylated-DNA-protein-cysteine methyltransferase-like protein